MSTVLSPSIFPSFAADLLPHLSGFFLFPVSVPVGVGGAKGTGAAAAELAAAAAGGMGVFAQSNSCKKIHETQY
jgi:hypothetical protein